MRHGWIGALILSLVWTGMGHAQAVVQGGIKDVVDVGNSTRTNLNSVGAISSTFTGVAFDTLGFSYVNVWALMSQASDGNGLRFQWASDLNSLHFRTLASFSVLGSTAFSTSFAPRARWFRVQYVNGLSSLTSTMLSTIFRGGAFNDGLASLQSMTGAVDLKSGVLVSTFPANTTTPPFPAGILTSIAGAVDLKAGAAVSVYPGATYTPRLGGINSFVIGDGTTFPVATPFQGPSGSLLMSYVGLSWSGPSFTSFVTERFVGTGQWLASTQIVAGTSGLRVCVKEFDLGLQSLSSSVGFYSAANGGSLAFSTPLWSSNYAAQGGINKSASGGGPEPIDKFCTLAGDSLWFGSLSSNSNIIWVNGLWSHRRF